MAILIFPLKLFGELICLGIRKMGRLLKFFWYMLAISFLPFVLLYKLFMLFAKSSKPKKKKSTKQRSQKANYFGDEDNYDADDLSWVDDIEEIDIALSDDD